MEKKSKIILSAILIILGGIAMISFINKENKSLVTEGESSVGIVPNPLTYEKRDGEFKLLSDTKVYVYGNTQEETDEIYRIGEYLNEKVSIATGYDIEVIKSDKFEKGSIYLTTSGSDNKLGNEGYKLDVSNDNIKIIANKPEGLFRGIQSLRQMFPIGIEKNELVKEVEWKVKSALIEDKPEYEYRGFMIDVARHFFSVDEIKRQIDFAAQYKINKLHLHLSDDQGWRLEIKKWPELTNIGGKYAVGGAKGGYYTQEEFKEIVKYAQERYIEVIPEFDMPGHTNAALASYGFLNEDGNRTKRYTGIEVGFSTLKCRDEETYNFIEDIIKEVSEISPSKYIHIGGDESDSTPKEDYDYFVGRVSEMVKKYGKTPIGWDPIDTSNEIDNTVVLQNWKDSNKVATEKKMSIIISIAGKAYIDMKYDKGCPYGLFWAGYTSIEEGYQWDPTDYAPKELVLGVEAPLWTENIKSQKAMDYMIYPRLLGHAEIGWTPKEKRNWDEYKVRLIQQGYRLENQGVEYYKDKEIWN